ncbi:hypothetical protein J6590_083473 [Homalodisca vitripennis]|nr:hypothetical protein J6590_083473 [Homalodisca vitripennis]
MTVSGGGLREDCWLASLDHRSDQMISYYSNPRKSLRWYVKVFFYLLDACLWNGKFIHSKLCPNSKMTYLQYRDRVIESFIQVLPTPRPGPSIRNSVQQHLPKKLEKRVKCLNCRLTEKKRKTMFFVCGDCKDDENKSFGLCVQDFFKAWH